MTDYTLGLYEKALPNNLSMPEKLSFAAKAGYDFLELSVDETSEKLLRLTDETLQKKLKEASDKTGVPYGSMCLSGHRKYPLGSLDEFTRTRSLEIMYSAIDLAVTIGIRIIQIAGYDVYYEQGSEKTRDYFLSNLQKSVDYAAKAGVMLAFETMETPFMNTVSKAAAVVKKINSPYLMIYPDIGNVTNGAADVLEDIKAGSGIIAAVHLKETVPGVFRDMQFGEGQVDFSQCIRQFKVQGVHRFVCEFWYDGKSEPFSYIQKSKKFFEGML